MGVLKRYRKTATVEYMRKAVMIHRLLMYEILKDFGTKKHVKDLMLIKKCSDEETKAKIEELEKVINESNVDKPYKAQLVYPKHFRSYIRRRFYQLLADFNDAVCFVYTTWATVEVEHSSRLIMTNKAISVLYTIKREYSVIDDICKGKLKNFVKMCNIIDEEIILLNGVRNTIRAAIKKNKTNTNVRG